MSESDRMLMTSEDVADELGFRRVGSARDIMNDEQTAMKSFKRGRRWLVFRTDFERWLKQYRKRGS